MFVQEIFERPPPIVLFLNRELYSSKIAVLTAYKIMDSTFLIRAVES